MLYQKRELERLSRGYIRAIYKYIGEKQDIPALDVNANGKIISWMVDESNTLVGKQVIGTLTGKTIDLEGSLGRTQATGHGVAYSAMIALEKLGIKIADCKIAVQ